METYLNIGIVCSIIFFIVAIFSFFNNFFIKKLGISDTDIIDYILDDNYGELDVFHILGFFMILLLITICTLLIVFLYPLGLLIIIISNIMKKRIRSRKRF